MDQRERRERDADRRDIDADSRDTIAEGRDLAADVRDKTADTREQDAEFYSQVEEMSPQEERQRRIFRRLARAVITLFAISVVGGAIGFYKIEQLVGENRHRIAENRALILQGKQAHDVQCALKRNLDARVSASKLILIENPDKVVFGIPRALIVQGVRRDESALSAFDVLKCKGDR